jgi:uncharacterized membrane protein YvbJ
MALIACPECAKEISDKALICPHCGHPMRGRQSAGTNDSSATKGMTPEDDVTPQATGREWRIVQLIGGLMMIIGVVAWIGNSSDAGMVFFLGCAIFLGGKLGPRWIQRT